MSDETSDIGGNWPSVELYEAISHQAVKAAGVDVAQRVAIIDIPKDPERYLIVDKDGEHELKRRDQPARQHKLLSILDVAAYASAMSGALDNEMEPLGPVIWVSPAAIIVTNDNDRLRGDRATYAVRQTDAYQTLTKLGSTDGMSQAEFLAFLRVEFARSFVSNDARVQLINSVRTIKAQQQSSIGQGSGSYEVGLESTAGQSIKWPDSIRLEVPVLDDPSIQTLRQIEVVLDVRPEDRNKPFKLSPLKEDLTIAMQKALAEAVDALKANVEEIPVYQGAP